MQQFNIREYVDFNEHNRAVCPSCSQSKGTTHKKPNLSIQDSGAYKCFAGCTPEDIRSALGVTKDHIIPTALAQPSVAPKAVTVSPQKIVEAHERLVSSNGPAKQWLHDRGITDGMIARHQLGITRAKVDKGMIPCLSIPIPNADGTAYYQKKREAPWLPVEDQPPGYKPWSQFGIPAKTWFTYLPVEAQTTWLCEGEWDAIRLGWAVRHADLPIAVATFTAGAGTVPPQEQLDLLPGQVVLFYDRNDKPTKTGLIPGDEGAKKVATALGDRARIAQVPMTDGCDMHGWDVSNALDVGFTLDDFAQAAGEATAVTKPIEEKGKKTNPLRSRLITNDELMATAPDYVEWLVPDLLPANELILLAAGPRAGKSLLSMLLAKSVATGEAFLDRPVTQGAVLYVRCEDAPVKIKQRQIAQGWATGLPVYWLDRFKLSQTAHLKEMAEELDVRLIVLDTLSRIRDDGTTESSAEMTRVIEPLQEMAEDLNCCIVLVHHTGKVKVENADAIDVFDTIRGSGSIRATCRGSMVLAADTDCYRLCAENGYGKIDLKIRLDGTTLEWKLLGRWTEAISSDQRSVIEEYLNKVGQATLDQIFDDTQIPKPSLYKVLSRLARENFIVKSGNRRQVLYTRSSDFIRLSGELSDEISPAGTGIQAHLTKNTSSLYEPKSDQLPKSDHPTYAKDDHFDEIDHFLEGGAQTQNCQVKPSNVYPVREISSDKSSDKRHLSDESDETPKPDQLPKSDQVHLTSPKSDQFQPKSDQSRIIATGDRVRYCGAVRSLVRVCGTKHLEVLEVRADSATVKHTTWLVTQTVPLADLRRVSVQAGGQKDFAV
ncbi:MAG: AAA family ATPase [Verrucomicrobia bacterium]|nr:AAA family ATPase [Leptolyngbya sp. ES-bin-22]